MDRREKILTCPISGKPEAVLLGVSGLKVTGRFRRGDYCGSFS
jgi:hypothetical protein